MGYDGVKTALAASKGEQVPATCRYRRQPRYQGQHELRALAGTPQPEDQVIRVEPTFGLESLMTRPSIYDDDRMQMIECINLA